MILNLVNFFINKKVLITGGAGFIGSHLAETLHHYGSKVGVYDLVKQAEASNLSSIMGEISYTTGSICDYELFCKTIAAFSPDIILHLAANASVPRSCCEPIYDFEQNAKGTTIVLEAIRNTAPEARIVLTSSGAVYGDPGVDPIKETDPLKPISNYGSSKLMSEIQIGLYQRTFGIAGSTARLFNCYGPRLPRFVVLDFLKKLELRTDELEILGDGKQTRDFTFVSDTVQGILRVAANGAAAEAYNIASGQSYDVVSLARSILELRHLRETKIRTTGSSWIGDAKYWRVDISKAKSIGYKPEVTLNIGLNSVLNWYDRQKNENSIYL